jgi:hypothetical protein
VTQIQVLTGLGATFSLRDHSPTTCGSGHEAKKSFISNFADERGAQKQGLISIKKQNSTRIRKE